MSPSRVPVQTYAYGMGDTEAARLAQQRVRADFYAAQARRTYIFTVGTPAVMIVNLPVVAL